jgi:Flp pilus assembly protein TadB
MSCGALVAASAGAVSSLLLGALAALALWWVWWRWRAQRADRDRSDPLALAAGWDLLAVGMRAGLPVAVAVRAVAEEFAGTAAKPLRSVADLLALGADPVAAWESALRHPDTAGVARAARRTARSGSGLADAASDLAKQARDSLDEQAQKRAQRAAVWVAAPLGLCFLPAFVCLGVLPVVVGMVERLALTW